MNQLPIQPDLRAKQRKIIADINRRNAPGIIIPGLILYACHDNIGRRGIHGKGNFLFLYSVAGMIWCFVLRINRNRIHAILLKIIRTNLIGISFPAIPAVRLRYLIILPLAQQAKLSVSGAGDLPKFNGIHIHFRHLKTGGAIEIVPVQRFLGRAIELISGAKTVYGKQHSFLWYISGQIRHRSHKGIEIIHFFCSRKIFILNHLSSRNEVAPGFQRNRTSPGPDQLDHHRLRIQILIGITDSRSHLLVIGRFVPDIRNLKVGRRQINDKMVLRISLRQISRQVFTGNVKSKFPVSII